MSSRTEGTKPKSPASSTAQVEQPIGTLLDLISCGDYNLHASLLNLPEIFSLFHDLDQHVSAMREHLSKIRFPDGDSTYVNLHLLSVSQCQMRNAFVIFLRLQSYDAQLVFRPGVEAAIFAFRIYLNSKLGPVWVNRFDDPKPFREAFMNDKMMPDRLPFGKDVMAYLKSVNDFRSHPNIGYMAGRIRRRANRLEMIYFDSSESFLPVLFQFLGVCLKILAVYRKIFGGEIKIFIADTEPAIQTLIGRLARIREIRLPTKALRR